MVIIIQFGLCPMAPALRPVRSIVHCPILVLGQEMCDFPNESHNLPDRNISNLTRLQHLTRKNLPSNSD